MITMTSGMTIVGGLTIGDANAPIANTCTWDPTHNFNGSTLSPDNLTQLSYTPYTISGGGNGARGTIGKTTGKWYFEYTPTENISSIQSLAVGITANYSSTLSMYEIGSQAYMWYFNSAGNESATYENGVYNPIGSYTMTTSDIGGIAFDLDNLIIYYYKNGALLTSSSLPSGLTWYPISANGSTIDVVYGVTANFGAAGFAYPPSGFSPIQNSSPPGTPELLIVKGTYPAQPYPQNTGTFSFAPSQGGGDVVFSGHAVYAGDQPLNSWGPELLFNNTRTLYDWCSSGFTTDTFGQVTFPVEVTITAIFIIPRIQNDHMPAQAELVVDGNVIGTYYSTTLTEGVSGQTIPYSGPGYKITPNVAGTTWRLNFNQYQVNIGEIEYWGYAS